MSTLVTGAAGFIGSHLTDHLIRGGEEVVGLDNFDAFYARNLKEENLAWARHQDRFGLVEGDIRDQGVLESLPDGIDTIVHLAARAGVRPSIANPGLYTDVNVVGTVRLLEFAKKRGIRTFIFASSSSVYGNNDRVPFSEADPVDHPVSPYAATKKAGELLCHTATHLDGMTTLCLRFFTVYGPRQRPDLAIRKFAGLLDAGEAIPMFGDGSTSRDYTYIDDIIDGLIKGIAWARKNEATHEVVNLGESRTITLTEMIDTIAGALGVDANIERRPMQPGDVNRTFADISKAISLFGYAPKTDFAPGIAAFVEWFRSRRDSATA